MQADDINYHKLADDAAFSLVKILSGYEDAAVNAARGYKPSVIARYPITLTSAFDYFYQKCPEEM